MLKFTDKQRQNFYTGAAITAAFIGLGDSVYLTISHYDASPVVCNLIDGCNTVLLSPWATIFGFPVSALGILYYATLLILLGLYLLRRKVLFHSGLLAVSTVGMMLSFWFLYLQIWEIEALCEYCILSLVSTLCVWTAALVIKPHSSKAVKNT